MDIKIKARIKQVPEDFCVAEILPDRRHSDAIDADSYPQEGNCVHCILKKRDMDQFKAVSFAASVLGISSKNIAICGTKDKKAVTTQRVSIIGCSKDDVGSYSSDNPGLKYLGRGPMLHIGELNGNRFEIVLRDISAGRDELEEYLMKIKKSPKFPNYFGEQRFGAKRPVSHIVGKHVIRKNFKSAVLDYISLVFPDERETIKEARLAAKTDLKKSLDLFPKSSYYERVMISHLIDNPDDYRGAFGRLPSNLQKLMVHAYQSYLFNKVLDAAVKKKIGNRMLEIPLFGFGMNIPKDKRLVQIMQDVLKEEGISLQDFRDDETRTLGSKGGRRRAFEAAHDFSVIDIGDDELNPAKLRCRISFSLKKGTYATTFLDTFFRISQ